jgi:hypothetical protein
VILGSLQKFRNVHGEHLVHLPYELLV